MIMEKGKKFDDARSIEKTLIENLKDNSNGILDCLTNRNNMQLESPFHMDNIELPNSDLSADRLMPVL